MLTWWTRNQGIARGSVLSLESASASVAPLPDLPAMSTARTCLSAIASAEAADYHRAMLEASADRYHPVVRRRLARGQLIPAVDYVRAQRVRHRLAAELQAASREFDVLVLPLVPVPPYPLAAAADPSSRRRRGSLDRGHAVHTNLQPDRSLHSPYLGRTRSGLRIGIQMAARPGDEGLTLRVARALGVRRSQRGSTVESWRTPGPALTRVGGASSTTGQECPHGKGPRRRSKSPQSSRQPRAPFDLGNNCGISVDCGLLKNPSAIDRS